LFPAERLTLLFHAVTGHLSFGLIPGRLTGLSLTFCETKIS